MRELISRQAAIDAVNRLSLGETDAVRLSMRIADYLNRMPSAQPTFDARDTQYNLPIGTDCISRQTAIEELTDKNVGNWIPVTERLPECDLGVEVGNIEWISCGMVHSGCFGRGGKYRDAYFRTWTDAGEGMDAKDADYWRAVTLPEPPKEELK